MAHLDRCSAAMLDSGVAHRTFSTHLSHCVTKGCQHLTEDLGAPPLQAPRFDFLDDKAIHGMIRGILRSKSDQELHELTLRKLLQEAVAKSGGHVREEDLAEKRASFVEAASELIPRELGKRVVKAVSTSRQAAERGGADAMAQIDSQTVLKTYFLTWSGLAADAAPSRQECMTLFCSAFHDAKYEAHLTHMAVFQEPHAGVKGGVQFHVCSAISEPVRWLPWKRALKRKGCEVNFAKVLIHASSSRSERSRCYSTGFRQVNGCRASLRLAGTHSMAC